MNWYKIAVRGEWWIIDGKAVFADIETGDTGHEAYVINHVRHEIAEAMGWDNDGGEFYDWNDEDKKQILSNLIETGQINKKQMEKKYGKDFLDQIPYKPNIFEDVAREKYNISQEQLDVADGTTEAREYGMKVLGWKRMADNNIETQALTEQDLNNICRGISDAYGDSDDINDDTKFNIEIKGNGKVFWNIPLSVMESGVMAVARHNNRGMESSPYTTYAKSNNWYKIAIDTENSLSNNIWQIPKETYVQNEKQQYKDIINKVDEIEKTQGDEARNKYYDEVMSPASKKYRQKELEWMVAVKAAISKGLITVEEAQKLGYSQSGNETEYKGWMPLPPLLYHVTTNKSSILQSKLKSRYELNMTSGTGLGGGEDETISFTDDINVARDIKQGIVELKQVAQNELTIEDMINMSKKGIGAKSPYYENFRQYADSYFGKGIFNLIEQNLITGTGKYNRTTGENIPPDDLYNWTPIKNSWNEWSRPMEDKDKVKIAMQLYKGFSPARESAGGPQNPLFFSIDEKSYGNLNKDNIAILECKIKPNSMGYQLGALGEWRTASGDVVESIKEVS